MQFRLARSLIYEASKSTCRICRLELRILDLLFGVGGGRGGDDDDLATQTPRTVSPEEPPYSVLPVLS